MTWYAIENIEEALESTREFLFPFEWRRWAKIAVIALFAGGFGAPNMPSNFSSIGDQTSTYQGVDPATQTGMHGLMSSNPMTALATGSHVSNAAIGFVVLLVIAGAAVFGILSSIFTFVFYRSLLDEEIHVRQFFSRYAGKGLRLFFFRLAFVLGMLLFVAAAISSAFVSPLFLVPGLLLGIPLFLLLSVFLALTNQFIPVKMMEEDTGVIEAWSRLWPSVESEWRQVLLYVVMRFLVGMVAGIASLFASLVVLVVLGIPLTVLGVVAYIVFKPFALVVLALGILAFAISVAYFIHGPVQTYFRYYALLTYHDLTSSE